MNMIECQSINPKAALDHLHQHLINISMVTRSALDRHLCRQSVESRLIAAAMPLSVN